MLVQNTLYPILAFIIVIKVSINQARGSSCQVYPSEYAYRDDSVTRAESASANCRRYEDNEFGDLPAGIFPTNFIHCDGTPLKLADTNFGSEQFSSNSHYMWPADSDGQLLFIFPTKVSLTNIILYYYSDSDRGRPRLIFYAVRDDFDIWDTTTTNTPKVDVASAREPAGPYSVSIGFNFTTMKVLMYKYTSNVQFAVSEVDFLTCQVPTSIISTAVTENSASSIIESASKATNVVTRSTTFSLAKAIDSTTMNIPSKTMGITPNLTTDTEILKDHLNSVTERVIAIVVSIAILLILLVALVIMVVALVYKRKGAQKKIYMDSSYSTLNRGTGQQVQIQPQSLQQDSAQLYDQIHLSPSTGQAEYVPKSETANINNQRWISQNSNPTHSTAGEDIAEHSSALNVGNQAITSQLSPQNAHESTSEQPTYAAVDTSKKNKFKKESEKKYPKCKAAEKGPPVLPYSGHEVPSASMQQKKANTTKEGINSPHTIEQLYTAIKKKSKDCEPKGEEETPSIPPVEELYTDVQKKPKSRSNADSNKDEASPPHTAEETQTAGEKPSQSATEDLYTAVMKKSNDSSAVDTHTAPPIPPHTIEELYTPVMKKPKSGAEDEEEAPPIPPYTATL